MDAAPEGLSHGGQSSPPFLFQKAQAGGLEISPIRGYTGLSQQKRLGGNRGAGMTAHTDNENCSQYSAS